MPYSNVPKLLWGKMDRCVESVQARQPGLSKQRAIAICHESVVSSKSIDEILEQDVNAKDRRKARRKANRALDRAQEKEAAGEELTGEERLALARASFKEEQPIDSDVQETADAIAGEVDEGEGNDDIGEILEQPKEINGVVMHSPYGGAKTWAELETFMEAQEMAGATRRATYEFEEMTNNILNDSEMSLEDKGRTISELANGLPARVESVQEKDDEPSFLGGLKDRMLGALQKAKLTRASINDLPDSSFAYIEPGGKKDEDGKTTPRSLRHYPIHDEAHVRNALARASQQINSGGKSAEIARKALPKIKSAAKRMKIGVKKSSGIEVYKDQEGNYRWFGRVSNRYRDRDWPAEPKLGGQILTEEAHKDFVAWVDEDPKNRMPWLWPWHTPISAKERADWIDYADGFLVMSGPLTETEAKTIERLSETYDLAMSHGLLRSEKHYNKERGLIGKYRTFEASYLPREHAANEWTDITAIAEEVAEMGFSDAKREFLVQALGEEKVMQLEQDTEKSGKALDALGVEWKEVAEALEGVTAELEDEPKDKPKEEPKVEPEFDGAKQLTGLSDFLEKQQDHMVGLTKTVDGLVKAVADLSKSDDEKVADAIRPRIAAKDTVPVWQRSASASKDNVIDKEKPEDKALADSKPGSPDGGWITEVMGGGNGKESAPIPK